jgi:hypothetical protein
VDSGLSYVGTPISTVSGLTHLNGKTVSVLADGYVLPQKVVTAGSISFSVMNPAHATKTTTKTNHDFGKAFLWLFKI